MELDGGQRIRSASCLPRDGSPSRQRGLSARARVEAQPLTDHGRSSALLQLNYQVSSLNQIDPQTLRVEVWVAVHSRPIGFIRVRACGLSCGANAPATPPPTGNGKDQRLLPRTCPLLVSGLRHPHSFGIDHDRRRCTAAARPERNTVPERAQPSRESAGPVVGLGGLVYSRPQPATGGVSGPAGRTPVCRR